jgi:hypothetical protein
MDLLLVHEIGRSMGTFPLGSGTADKTEGEGF